MTMPVHPDDAPREPAAEPVDLHKPADEPFDPYRFGRPDHPVPPEFAPPGYAPPGYAPPGYAPPSGGGSASQWPPAFTAPAPPPYHSYEQPGTGNGKAIAALVLGIGSILLCWLSIFDIIFVALAVVFAMIVLNQTKAASGRPGNGRGLAVAGLSCAIVGAVLATLLTVRFVHAIDGCGGLSHPDTSSAQFQQCLQDTV